MLCALVAIGFGMLPQGVMYKACSYKCPKPSIHYHYPIKIRTHPRVPCPPYIIEGKPT